MIMGIDPGQNGGLAIMSKDRIVHFTSVMPILAKELEYQKLIKALGYFPIDMIYLEKVGAMPRQGVTSMFNFGKHFGELLGVINTLRIPYTLTRPLEWQKTSHKGMSKDMSPKERSLKAVKNIYPDLELRKGPRSKVPHDGIVDAVLIALHGVKDYYIDNVA